MATGEKVSAELERWLGDGEPATLGGLVDRFGTESFALIFVVLMALPALPLPTGAASHVLEVVTMLLALELIVGRRQVWLPRRWTGRELGSRSERFAGVVLRWIRRLERFSRPRLETVLRHRLTGAVYGAVVLVLTLTAFLAPPFSGLDTLPALGVVVMSLGFVLADFAVAAAGLVIGATGVAVVVGLGGLILRGLSG